MGQADPKFQKWVKAVSPSPEVASSVFTSVDWTTVLQLLVQIFEIVVQMGCFAAAKVSGKVKAAMFDGTVPVITTRLQFILNDLKSKKGGFLKSLFLLSFLIPLSSYASASAKHPEHAHSHQGVRRHIEHQVTHHSYSVRQYDFPRMKGLKRTEKSKQFIKDALKFVPSVATVPGSFDMSGKVSLPENQGQCGSCWDFGITKGLRSSLMLAGTDPGVLSFNWLLWNEGPVKESGCGGGDFDAGGNMVKGLGPCLASASPYTAGTTGDDSPGNYPSIVAGTAIEWVTVGDGSSAPSFQLLASALSSNHFLVVDVAADNSWSNYSSGIWDNNTSNSIDHIINETGYDCETSKDAQGNCVFGADGNTVNHDGYFWAMNNWGESWGTTAPNGHGGYMKTRWQANNIAETAMFFNVVQPAPPVPPTPTPVPPTPVPPTPVPVPPVPVPSTSGLPIWAEILIVVALMGVSFGVGKLTK